MKKQEIFNAIVALVEEETEVSRNLILSRNIREDVVDARSLLVNLLCEYGFYPQQICELSGICTRSINAFLCSFYARKEERKLLRINYENVKMRIRTI